MQLTSTPSILHLRASTVCIIIQDNVTLCNGWSNMKQQRHSAIRQILDDAPIASQSELRRQLAARGFHVTQATLSRDIRELQLYQGCNAGYRFPQQQTAPSGEDDSPGTPRSPPKASASKPARPSTSSSSSPAPAAHQLSRLLHRL